MMLFDNNFVYQSPCESIVKIATFLALRRLPIVGTGAAALVAESWQSRYYIILYYILWMSLDYQYISGAEGVPIYFCNGA